MLQSPAKRRKTRARPTAARKMIATWPEDRIPIEIFSLVISYLPRSNVQNMRLVNKEFEKKVAHDLFQTVVVPFSPEIYGIAGEPTDGSAQSNSNDLDDVPGKAAVMLQDKGMRIFEGFGEHIHRFGMSFEFDYQLLMRPPIKSDQEAITTFWGIYRWPFKKYNRYVQLEGLEETADETRTMAKALRFIGNSRELALSIDGGLGWLAGPDVNTKIHPGIGKAIVFGESRFRPEERSPPARPAQRLKPSMPSNSPMSNMTSSAVTLWSELNNDSPLQINESAVTVSDGAVPIFLRILREAGYEGENLAQSVRTLMESEGVMPPASFSSSSSCTSSTAAQPETETESDLRPSDPHSRSFWHEDLRTERVTTALRQATMDLIESCSSDVANSHLLKPNDLTNAQKEILLETEWAQRAFMQSYAIAIIDNPTSFRGIETLSIARLPSRHLTILRRGDFWACLSQLRKLSLAIIPDWRDVIKRPESWVEDVRLQPSQAILGVYQLLRDYVAPRESVKVIHFEWLCGGEEAPGLFARNQLILAAPLVPRAMDMVDRTRPLAQILTLPHVEHLTLKNCWTSPHILGHFTRTLRGQALQTLTFNSVSLCAPAPRDAKPGPIHTYHPQHHLVHHVNANFHTHVAQLTQNQFGGAANPAAPVLIPTALPLPIGTTLPLVSIQGPPEIVPAPSVWLERPRVGSWAHLIDRLSPGETLASLRHACDLGPRLSPPEPTQLKKIIFNSCGYIRLLLDFDQTMLDPFYPNGADTHAAAKRRGEIEQYMMKAQEHTLGVIINHINEDEARTLESAWNLRMGWGKSNKMLAVQASADGIRAAGQGRFRGKIESSLLSSP